MTPPCYLTINQSENCAGADPILWDTPPSPCLYKWFAKILREVWSFWAQATCSSSIGTFTIKLHFPSLQPGVSRLASLPAGERTWVWFSNKTTRTWDLAIMEQLLWVSESKDIIILSSSTFSKYIIYEFVSSWTE